MCGTTVATLHHCDWSRFPVIPVNAQRYWSTIFYTETYYAPLLVSQSSVLVSLFTVNESNPISVLLGSI